MDVFTRRHVDFGLDAPGIQCPGKPIITLPDKSNEKLFLEVEGWQ